MKKLILLTASVCMIGFNSLSQQVDTNAPVPTIQSATQSLLDAFTKGNTNWYYEGHFLYADALPKHTGGGIGAFYPLSQYVVTGLRLDYVNGGFVMPSGNGTLQIPLKIRSWLTVTPFTYAGIGIPVSGAKIGNFTVPGSVKDNNGQPTAILGYGCALRLITKETWTMSLIGDRETWSGFAGKQYRIGMIFDVKF